MIELPPEFDPAWYRRMRPYVHLDDAGAFQSPYVMAFDSDSFRDVFRAPVGEWPARSQAFLLDCNTLFLSNEFVVIFQKKRLWEK